MPHTNERRSPTQIAPPLRCFVAILVNSAFVGCEPFSNTVDSTWHEKFNWNAEDYFDDPKVIALCRAIEADDIAEIDRLVAAGADVNAKGKGSMTPLLWAFPDNKLERFKRLLEHGADPNVVVDSDFGTRSAIMPGESVTHMASGTAFPGYFEAVFAHGGDPNLIKNGLVSDQTPLFTLIGGKAHKKNDKVRLLLDKGADPDHVDGTGITATMTAVGRGHYDVALTLLEAGADPRIYQSNQAQKLSHVVARQVSTHLKHATPQQKVDYQKLVDWLERHGESLDVARADIARWDTWSRTTGEFRRKMDAEIAERKASRKAAAENAAQE